MDGLSGLPSSIMISKLSIYDRGFRVRWVWHIAIVLGLSGLYFGVSYLSDDASRSFNQWQRDPKARSFALERIPAGAPVVLSQYLGGWALVNFWASWCRQCRTEKPYLEKLDAMEDVSVVGIASYDQRKAVEAMALPYTVAFDELGETAQDYGVSGLPYSFLVDPKGIIAKVVRGPFGSTDLEDVLKIVAQAQQRVANVADDQEGL